MRSPHRLRHAAVIAALSLAPVACSSSVQQAASAGSVAPDSTDDDRSQPAEITFRNDALNPVDLFALLPGGATLRVGWAQPGQTTTFHLASSIVATTASVDFIARDRLNARVVRSGPLSVRPGDRLAVTLPGLEDLLSVLPAR